MARLVQPTRAEEGCLRYSLYRAKEDPTVWLLFEEWRSEADLKAHVETPHMRAFLKDAGALIDGGPTSYLSQRVA